MDDLIQRLKERKMVQWALAYLAGAWLILQVLEVTAEPWALPSGLIRAVQAGAVLGFFVTLVLAWYHGEQGQQKVSSAELLIIGGLLAVAAVLVMIYRGPADELADGGASTSPPAVTAVSPLGEVRSASIAVLPFRNNSPDAENAFFADGVHEDILTQLSKISDLTVLSRSAVMQYRGLEEVNLGRIAEELGATAILEGSVRRVMNQIRVSAQLIDAATAANLWAETYDRDLEDVFAVQSEIAQEVAEALQATLTPREIELISRVPTGNLGAYDYYLRGREAYFRHTPSDNDEAIRLYKLALDLDPEYALAWAGLAQAYADRPYRLSGDPAWSDSALVVAQRALELDPDEAAVHNARGFVYGARGWRQRAYEAYLQAWQLDPNGPSAINNVGASHRARGRLDEALTWYQRALRIDPTSELYRTNIAFIYVTIGDTARFVQMAREDLSRFPRDAPSALQIEAELSVLDNGDHERALQIWEELLERSPASAAFRLQAAEAAFMIGDFERVVEHMEEVSRVSPTVLDAAVGSASRPRGMFLYGFALMRTGEEDRGRDLLRQLIERRQAQIDEGNEDAFPRVELAVAHAALGNTAEALAEFEEAREIGRSYVAGLLGPRDAYLRAFELSGLASQPRFEAMVAQLRADVAEMRDRIHAAEAGAA